MRRCVLALSAAIAILALSMAGRTTGAQSPGTPLSAEHGFTSATFPAQQDAATDSLNPNNNYGPSTRLRIGRSLPNVAGLVYSYLLFDLASIPPTAAVETATVYLYQTDWSGDAPFRGDVYGVANTWDESKITWSNQPQPLTFYATLDITASTGFKAWDVTNLARYWVKYPSANVGLVLVPGPQTGFGVSFNSGETNIWPRLVVEYSLTTPTPTPSPTRTASPASTGTPTASPTPSGTATPTPTRTASLTATPSLTPLASATLTHAPTASPTATPSPTLSPTAVPSPAVSATTTPTATRTRTASPSATPSRTRTPTMTVTPTTPPAATPTDTPTAMPLPDLIITALWSESNLPSADLSAPFAPAGGETSAREGHLLCYQVMNIGAAAVPAGHTTQLFVDGAAVGLDRIEQPLQPGARLDRCFNLSWACGGAQDQLRACADSQNEWAEASEKNNCFEDSLRCDTTAPVITTGPSLLARNDTSVQICWNTDEVSTSLLRYDVHAGEFAITLQNSSPVTRHCNTLINLPAATTFQYYVESCDAAGNCTRSPDSTFQTRARFDNRAPAVSLVLSPTLSGKAKIGASASDDQAVDRVEFLLDGRVMHVDFAAPFEWALDTRDLPEGGHGFQARAFDAFGNSSEAAASSAVRNHLDAQLSPLHVRITAPAQGDGVYGSVPIVAEVTHDVSSTIRSLQFEVDGTSVAIYSYPPCDLELGGPRGRRLSAPCGAVPLVETARWSASGLASDSAHVIEVHAQDWDDNWGHASARVTIQPPDPVVNVVREVQRLGTRFEVTLAIANRSSVEVRDLDLSDLNPGFQPLGEVHLSSDGASFGPAEPCGVTYVAGAHASQLQFRHPRLGAAETLWVRYYAVPILFHRVDDVSWPVIGDRLTLSYHAYDRDYSQEPRTRWSSSEERARAFAASDYLVLTNPAALLAADNAADVDALLCAMARLASAQQGVLGYLPAADASLFACEIKELFIPGGDWAARLGANFSAPNPETRPAFLLIVGEIEVVPSFTHDVSALGITWSDGTRTDAVDRSDNYFADTVGNDSRPDLTVGRVIGNTARDLRTPIESSLAVQRGTGFDRSAAVVLSGYETSAADTFVSDAENAAADLTAQGLTTTRIDWSNWVEASWAVDARRYDGFALADIDNDDIDEALVAREGSGDIAFFEPDTGAWIRSIGSAFTRYGGLASGDVDGDGVDEIVVAVNRGGVGTLGLHEPDGRWSAQVNVDWANWDCLALGDVLGDGWAGGEWISDGGREEIVTISEASNRVRIYRLTPSRALAEASTGSWTTVVDFTRHDGMGVGNVSDAWARDEIVIIRNDDQRLYVYSGDGTEVARPARDFNSDGSDDSRFTRYDGFAMGRVDGDGLDEILVPVDEDDKLYMFEAAGTRWFASKKYSRLMNDWFEGICYTGDDARYDGFAVGRVFAGKGARAVVLRNRDGPSSRVYVLPARQEDMDLLANQRLGGSGANASVIAIHGHGNPGGPSPLSIDYADQWGALAQHPFVFSMSCLTGDYDDLRFSDDSFGEALFDRGAGAFVGSSEVSSVRHNHDTFVRYFADDYDLRDAAVRAGSAFTQYKRARADDSSRWKFWAIEYNYYGDPKFGPPAAMESSAPAAGHPELADKKSHSADTETLRLAAPPPTQGDNPSTPVPPQAGLVTHHSTLVTPATRPSSLVTLNSPPSTLAVTVPAYTVQRVNDLDIVSIPGGDVLLEDGQPEVPVYPVTVAIPAGYRVQAVTMTARSGLGATLGLSLPVFVAEVDGLTTEHTENTEGSECHSEPRGEESPLASPGNLRNLWLDSSSWVPTRDYTWQVVPESDGSSQLVLTLYPFQYNPLTTDVRFYRDYAFDIRYTQPAVTITLLSLDRAVYNPGQTVTVSLGLDSASAQPVVVEATVRRYGSGEVIAGLLLRTLQSLAGPGSFQLTWNSTGFAPGEYYVDVALRDTLGQVLDQATQRFRLGAASAQVTALTARPAAFRVGERVEIAMDVRNTGSVALTGTAVIEVRSFTGRAVVHFEYALANLAPAATRHLDAGWTTTGNAPGAYTVIGQVRWESTAATASVPLTGRGASVVYLPLMRR